MDVVAELGYEWTLGPILIGVLVNTYLFGITFCQFIAYYRLEFGDPIWMKLLVIGLFTNDIVQSSTMLYVPWFYFVKHYNCPSMIGRKDIEPVWALMLTPFCSAVAAFLTQTFLGLRVFKLTQNLILFALLFVSTICAFVMGMIVGVRVWTLHSLDAANDLQHLIIPWVIFHSGTDMALTVALCRAFWVSHTGNRQIDWALNRLFRKTLQTGLPVYATTVIFLGTFVVFGTNANRLYTTFGLNVGRIYSATILDTLIVRKQITKRLNEPDVNISQTIGFRGLSSSSSLDPDQVELGLVRVNSATSIEETRPAVVYFHGGGFTVGNRKRWFPNQLHKLWRWDSHSYLQTTASATAHEIRHSRCRAISRFWITVSTTPATKVRLRTDGEAIAPQVSGSTAGGLYAYYAAMQRVSHCPKAIISMYEMGTDFFTPSSTAETCLTPGSPRLSRTLRP